MSSKAQASIEITASSSRLADGLRAAAAKFRDWSGTVARGVGAAWKGVNKHLEPGATMKNALGYAGGQALTRGFDALVGSAEHVRDFERSLVRLQITAGKGPEMASRWRTSIRAISRETAIADDEVLAGAQTYIDLTGDVDGAEKAMRSFARIAQASGSTVQDVAGASAALQQSMHLDPSKIEDAFSGLIIQGKKGAVSLKDMAAELAGLAPRFAKFRGAVGGEGIREMGAAFQVVRQGFGGASEAATGLESLMGGLTENADKFAKYGVKIFDKDPKTGVKTLRPFLAIVEDIGKSKIMKDPTALGKALGRKEAQQAFDMLNKNLGLYHELYDAASDTGAVQRDQAAFLTSDAGRLDKAFNSMKLTIAEAFTPERITGFVNAVEALAEKLGPVVDGIGKIGSALGASYRLGESIRGWWSDNGNPFQDDFVGALATKNMGGLVPGGDNSDEAIARRKRQASSAIADHETWTKVADDIMGGEVNERVSAESVKRALAHKYHAKRGFGQGDVAEEMAGALYLKKAGVKDPVTAIQAANAGINSALQTQLIAKAIRDGFLMVQANAGTTVKLGDNQVAKSVAKSTEARRRTR